MDRPPAASQDEVRRHNLGSLLELVHVHGDTSRSELAARLGLNRSTVKALTAELSHAGLIRECTPPPGSGGIGRPSLTVRPASDLVHALALDVGVEHLTAVRVGLGGEVLDRRELRQSPTDYGVARTLTRLHRLVRELQAGAAPEATCIGIGVGVCGIVSADDGVVRFAPNLDWVDVPLRDLLTRRLGTTLPIELGNDGALGARAEHLRGAAVGYSDVIYLSGEVGVGGGIIWGGRPMRGTGGYGGEIGHMSIDPKGRLCRCGRRGCWETEIGDEAVLLATGAPPGAVLQDVLAAYADGARWTQAGMRRVGRALGAGVVNLVNIFNPQLVLFGGVSRDLFTALSPMVNEALTGALTASGEQVRLGLPALGDDSIAVGAAELVFARLLANPLGERTVRSGVGVGVGA